MKDTHSDDIRYVVKWAFILGGLGGLVQFTVMTIAFFMLI